MNPESTTGIGDRLRPSGEERTPPRLAAALIALYCLLAFLADLWPLKNISPGYGWPIPRSNVLALGMDLAITPAMRYSTGDNCLSFSSLPYVAAVKAVQAVIPRRLLCLRVVSVLCTAVALAFLYRTAALAFSPPIGALYIFLLITSPFYLEETRSFGYIPFTNAIVAIACYVAAAALLKGGGAVRIPLLGLLSYSTLSLYATGRLVIVFVIALLATYIRSQGKKLALFACVLIALVGGLDRVFADIRFSLLGSNALLCSERTPLGALSLAGSSLPSLLGQMRERVRQAIVCSSYYFSLRYRPFFNEEDDEWNRPPNLVSAAYLPFFIAGLALCLRRMNKGHVYLLWWFAVFYLSLFVSDRLLPRRILFGLNPVFLLISVGLWKTFGIFRRPRAALLVRVALGVFLGVLGSYHLWSFFFRYSRPEYDFSREQLRQLATVIRSRGRQVRAIRYNRFSEVLIWGNPYVDAGSVDRRTLAKLEVENWDYACGVVRPHYLPEQIEFARGQGGNILYMHTFPKNPPDGRKEDRHWPPADIRRAESDPAGRVEIFQLPGVDEVYFMLVKATATPPAP
jgi:hypothetical protein